MKRFIRGTFHAMPPVPVYDIQPPADGLLHDNCHHDYGSIAPHACVIGKQPCKTCQHYVCKTTFSDKPLMSSKRQQGLTSEQR